MWKKLSALLFEEEDEILEEEKVQKIKKEVKKVKKEEPVEALVEPVETPVEEFEDLPVKPSSFGLHIDAEESVVKEEPIVRKVYEFHPVISPIFGVTESHVHDNIPKVVDNIPATLPKSVINTVISPIYGDLETKTDSVEYKGLDSVKPVDLSLKSNQSTLEERKPTQSQTEPAVEMLSFEDYEEIDLEDLLQSYKAETKTVDSLDDAHQFTLFDEDKV